jgi:hypothetical protein
MTSLPRSRFSLGRGPKRGLYLSGQRLTAYEWRHGQLAEAFVFHGGEEGLSEFSTYLSEAHWVPLYLLVDLAEEEYRRDTIPHVGRRDRRQMVAARTRRFFRDTPYWTHRVQGRESGGRRDDRVLYAAITSPGLLTPWLTRIHEARAPLAGVYSLPLLTERLVSQLAPQADNALVMSLQSNGNLRQSFFLDGHLKISRLAHMPASEPVPLAEAMLDEAEKLRRYLNSLRLLGRETRLNVLLLAHGPVFGELAGRVSDLPGMVCQLRDTEEIGSEFGLSRSFVAEHADPLFVHLLLQDPPANHFATSRDTRYHSLRKVRSGMYAASVVLGLAGFTWGGLNVVDGLVFKQRGEATRQQANYYEERYREAREGLPEIPAEAEQLKQAVENAARLAANRVSPFNALDTLSLALDAYPDLRVERIQWALGPGPTEQPQDPRARALAELYGQPRDEDARHAIIDGRVFPFDGNYREALDMLRAFAENLKGYAGVQEVKLVSLPLNLSPNEQLRGDALSELSKSDAAFQIKVVFGQESDGPA